MHASVWAEALYRAAQEGHEHERLLAGLREALARRGKLSLLPAIARDYQRLVEKRAQAHDAELALAQAGDAEELAEELAEAKRMLDLSARHVRVRVDDSLIGGYRLVAGSAIIDASYKRMLLDLYRQLVK